jgi:hypothetical protein|tara:strand:+ start:183 stop:353 length:171 start_codon:yes stop_codon:yes gene_type:complete
MMSREQELAAIDAYIEKNGATLLPPDERGPDFVMSPWKRSRGRKKTKKDTKDTKKS